MEIILQVMLKISTIHSHGDDIAATDSQDFQHFQLQLHTCSMDIISKYAQTAISVADSNIFGRYHIYCNLSTKVFKMS